MRKIKLNNGSYVEVNEKIHFLEGLALVDGKVLITNRQELPLLVLLMKTMKKHLLMKRIWLLKV